MPPQLPPIGYGTSDFIVFVLLAKPLVSMAFSPAPDKSSLPLPTRDFSHKNIRGSEIRNQNTFLPRLGNHSQHSPPGRTHKADQIFQTLHTLRQCSIMREINGQAARKHPKQKRKLQVQVSNHLKLHTQST